MIRARLPQVAEVPDFADEDGLDERPASRAVRWNFILFWVHAHAGLMGIAKGLGYGR